MPNEYMFKLCLVQGPSCDNVCESVGLLASIWRIPVISFGCWSDDLDNREDYGTLLRTTGSFNDIGVFFKSIMQNYKWKRVTLVTGPQTAWMKAVASLTVQCTVVFRSFRLSFFSLSMLLCRFLYVSQSICISTRSACRERDVELRGKSVRSWCDGSSDRSFMGWTH